MILSSRKSVKATSRPRSVAVIVSSGDLARALRLRRPPDLYELRLDGLVGSLEKFDERIRRLQRPIILTARSPREGGLNNLSSARRRDLLLRFLRVAAMVDIELSSAIAFSPMLEAVRAAKLQLILSRHDVTTSPTLNALQKFADHARSLGADIFKIVVRVDNEKQLRTLIDFARLRSLPLPVSAMGVGKLGRTSRRMLARSGSILNYAHLGHATIAGQLSLAQLRAVMDR
jgi:3-dehydroquinate dehydratase type I